MDVRNIADVCLVQDELNNVVFGYHLSKISVYDSAVYPKFLFYFLSQSQVKKHFLLNSSGVTIIGLAKTTIENTNVILPSFPEQQAIADFLDRKTAQIDTLIEKKQRQIDLLQEQRTALINHAVTKGLNPKAKMKDSGVEWLGEIPSHWEVMKLKRIVKGNLAYGANEPSAYADYNSPRYIRITDFDDNGNLRQDTFRSLPHELAKDYLLKDGDILFARSGATVGKTFQFKDYEGLACFAGYLIKADPDESIVTSDFLYLFTKSQVYETWKNSIFIQATIQNIGANKYQMLDVPIPSIEEQKTIISWINQKVQKIDNLILKNSGLINLFQEYRTALISEAVTGKIDVRTTE